MSINTQFEARILRVLTISKIVDVTESHSNDIWRNNPAYCLFKTSFDRIFLFFIEFCGENGNISNWKRIRIMVSISNKTSRVSRNPLLKCDHCSDAKRDVKKKIWINDCNQSKENICLFSLTFVFVFCSVTHLSSICNSFSKWMNFSVRNGFLFCIQLQSFKFRWTNWQSKKYEKKAKKKPGMEIIWFINFIVGNYVVSKIFRHAWIKYAGVWFNWYLRTLATTVFRRSLHGFIMIFTYWIHQVPNGVQSIKSIIFNSNIIIIFLEIPFGRDVSER